MYEEQNDANTREFREWQSGESAREGGLTLSEAERISGVNKGVISRAADDQIESSGAGRDRRLDPASFCRWLLSRSAGREESNAEVERKINKHCKD